MQLRIKLLCFTLHLFNTSNDKNRSAVQEQNIITVREISETVLYYETVYISNVTIDSGVKLKNHKCVEL